VFIKKLTDSGDELHYVTDSGDELHYVTEWGWVTLCDW